MRKFKLLLMLFVCGFIFTLNVKAEGPNIICPSNVTTGNPFTCTITTDEVVNVVSDLKVYKGKTTMSENGSIEFKTNEEGSFDISILNEDYTNTFNTVTVVAKKPVTTTKTTTTTTTKKKSSNNYLSSIMIDGKQINDFSKDKTKYYVNVTNDTLKVIISVKVEDETASYDINGPQTLEVGDNEYTIGVTSEDNTTKFYKIIVTRVLEEESNNTRISSLKVSGYKLNFDGNSKTYHLKIDKDDNKLNIKVDLEDETASYEIEGNSNLKNGSVVKIVVTAENNEFDTYRIIISKEQKPNYIIYVVIGASVLVIILLIIFMIRKKKNKEKNNNAKNESNYNKKADDLEKTIQIPNINNTNKSVDNDDVEETKVVSYEEEESLDKTKVVDLNSEIEKVFEDTFKDINND